ncbi:aspartyl protease family protein [Sphingomonas sp. BK580]|uniref:aspartyl protease family protein n=1 Tax=Sphingomonas sp. BK580 TaxID=2586972 RepID=UPI00161BB265|nr:aspartyl protease family protein [Sphingomonas sp. BK580]MBB3693612.1 hypothetical protein [Sphingomonas sp. BK580]
MLVLPLLLSIAPTAVAVSRDPAALVLESNRAATKPATHDERAVRLRYAYAGQGLTGTSEAVVDLRKPAFVATRQIGRMLEQEGFDGRRAWARERSGSVSIQSGGDMQALALSEAYRLTNRWWRPDRGGAAVSYVGRRRLGEGEVDVVRVAPQGGTPFEAGFDASTHLLARIEETRHGQTIVVSLSKYRMVGGTMVAGRMSTGTVEGGEDETQTLIGGEYLRMVPSSCCRAPKWLPADALLEDGAKSSVVPFRIVNGHIYADVMVNGKGPFPFLFDTGGVNILTPETARISGLTAAGALTMRGAGEGAVVGGIGNAASIAIGGAVMRNQPLRVLPLSDIDITPGGMIGFETFRRYVTRIDYGSRTLEFVRRDAFDRTAAGTEIPLRFYGNLPIVEGSFQGHEGGFVIDTGNPGGLFLSSPFSRRYELERAPGAIRTIAGVGIGGNSYGLVFRGGPLRLGGVTVRAPVSLVSTDRAGAMADSSVAGNVGAGILKRFAVTLDYAGSALFLSPVTPPPADLDRYDRSGMSLTRKDGTTRVTAVVSGGPAQGAGVRTGDAVLALDGKTCSSMTLDEIRAAVRDQPVGTRVRLSLSHEGQPVSATLTLRDLI